MNVVNLSQEYADTGSVLTNLQAKGHNLFLLSLLDKLKLTFATVQTLELST